MGCEVFLSRISGLPSRVLLFLGIRKNVNLVAIATAKLGPNAGTDHNCGGKQPKDYKDSRNDVLCLKTKIKKRDRRRLGRYDGKDVPPMSY